MTYLYKFGKEEYDMAKEAFLRLRVRNTDSNTYSIEKSVGEEKMDMDYARDIALTWMLAHQNNNGEED